MTAPGFGYADDIIERFPSIRGEVLVVTGLDNTARPGDLDLDYRDVQRTVAAGLTDLAPADRSSIKAWRSVFSQFGVKPTQHRNAAEALLRRLGRHGDIPSINPAVDIGNLISISNSLPVAAFDVDALTGPVEVRFAEGTESFTGIGNGTPESPAHGEVVFVDGDGQVAARRWCWKQSGHSATKVETRTAMFVIEAVHDDAPSAVQVAANELVERLARHQPAATVERKLVDPSNPRGRFSSAS